MLEDIYSPMCSTCGARDCADPDFCTECKPVRVQCRKAVRPQFTEGLKLSGRVRPLAHVSRRNACVQGNDTIEFRQTCES